MKKLILLILVSLLCWPTFGFAKSSTRSKKSISKAEHHSRVRHRSRLARKRMAAAPASVQVRGALPSENTLGVDTRRLDTLFHAHGTESARTLRPWQFSYSRVAGQDSIEGTFLTNSINVGVFDWLQIGTNPLLWIVPNTQNVSAKVGFYNSESFAFALGYFHVTSTALSHSAVHLNGLSVISNWFINSDWALSYVVQASHGYFGILDTEIETFTPVSHFMDVQYRLSSQVFMTSGLTWSRGRTQKGIVQPTDFMTAGVGSSLTWKIPPSWFFVYPSFGLQYYPELNDKSFLMSLYFQ